MQLDEIQNVKALANADLEALVGKKILAIVYKAISVMILTLKRVIYKEKDAGYFSSQWLRQNLPEMFQNQNQALA